MKERRGSVGAAAMKVGKTERDEEERPAGSLEEGGEPPALSAMKKVEADEDGPAGVTEAEEETVEDCEETAESPAQVLMTDFCHF